MQQNQRGVDLLVDVLDAADHVEDLTHDDLRRLLREVTEVLCPLLQRDAAAALRQEERPVSIRSKPVAQMRPIGSSAKNRPA